MTGIVAGCLAQNRMWPCAVVRAAACTGQQTSQATVGHRLEKDGHSFRSSIRRAFERCFM